jgi:hypothetical protein
VFSEHQKDLAGTDGAARLTRLYGEVATLAVVIYREGYGRTNWTRIEESAITSRGIQLGWDTVFLISLDGTHPDWLPPARLWFWLPQYGARVGADAILARFAELRESGRPDSHLARATRSAQRLADAEEARQWRGTMEAVRAVQQELQWMREYLSGEADELNDVSETLHARYVAPDHLVFGLDAQGTDVRFGWSFEYGNSLTNTALTVQERAAPDVRHLDIRFRYARPLKAVLKLDYEPVLGDDRSVLWQSSSESGKPCFTSKQLIDRHLRNLVDHSSEVLQRMRDL